MFQLRRKSLTAAGHRLDQRELIQRTRIVVVDDEDTFPFEVLRREGYSIDHWTDVENIGKLEDGFYDIIALDIAGVGTEISKDEGVGVLRHIKDRNANQIVVAYSGQSYEPEKIPFFQLADDFVPKSASVLQWKEKLDRLIQERVSITSYWQAIRAIAVKNGASEVELRALERAILKSSSRNSLEDATRVMRATLGHLENAAVVASLILRIWGLMPGS